MLRLVRRKLNISRVYSYQQGNARAICLVVGAKIGKALGEKKMRRDG